MRNERKTFLLFANSQRRLFITQERERKIKVLRRQLVFVLLGFGCLHKQFSHCGSKYFATFMIFFTLYWTIRFYFKQNTIKVNSNEIREQIFYLTRIHYIFDFPSKFRAISIQIMVLVKIYICCWKLYNYEALHMNFWN